VIVCDPGIPPERYQHPVPDAWPGQSKTRRGVNQRGSDQPPRSTPHVITELRQFALWPLRRVGVDAGRAIANARPQPGQLRAWRREQLFYITDRIAAHHDQATAPAGGTAGPVREVPDIWKGV
jgi:hypothetical protein